MRDKVILFKSRYTCIFEKEGNIEIVVRPSYWIVIFLSSVYLGLLSASFFYYEGFSLVGKVVLLSFFILGILHGVLRATFMYPFLFTKEEVFYKKNLWLRFKSIKKKLADIDYLEFKELTDKKVVLSAVSNSHRDEIIILSLDKVEHKKELLIVESKLTDLGFKVEYKILES